LLPFEEPNPEVKLLVSIIDARQVPIPSISTANSPFSFRIISYTFAHDYRCYSEQEDVE
jgi:hypothetical protein